MKIANRCFVNVAQFTYLGTTLTNQNLFMKEIKRRMNSGNALLPFGPERFVFSSSVQRHKN
jgi:hypothetical protein